MQDVIINREPVELYKILKFEGLVASGGEAKMAVAEGLVSVNGEIEMRKRCKLKAGDIIEFNGESFRLIVDHQTE
ncbi:MAG: ribosome-associated protein [Arenicella sp.]|jgi:ribosome-associated protein